MDTTTANKNVVKTTETTNKIFQALRTTSIHYTLITNRIPIVIPKRSEGSLFSPLRMLKKSQKTFA